MNTCGVVVGRMCNARLSVNINVIVILCRMSVSEVLCTVGNGRRGVRGGG